VTAEGIRTNTAVAGIAAALVILAHLAWKWGSTNGVDAKRTLAFDHGIALAIVLGLVLIAGRVALYREPNPQNTPIADAVAIIGTIAVLANLARVWRDNSTNLRDFYVTAGHIAAFFVVWGVTAAVRRIERHRRIEA
jgi:phosphoribosylformylglycinamidine (FGAM) synthase-like enzyme